MELGGGYAYDLWEYVAHEVEPDDDEQASRMSEFCDRLAEILTDEQGDYGIGRFVTPDDALGMGLEEEDLPMVFEEW